MSDDVRADARRLREGVTPEKWVKWEDFEAKEFTFDGIPRRDAEFIAAAPTLVDRLLAELDQVTNARRMDVSVFQDLMRSVVAAAGKTYDRDNHGLYQDTVETIADTRAERDAALATLQQVRDLHNADGFRWEGFPRADRRVVYCTYCQQAAPCETACILGGVS
ncbi:hypothetical protein [Gordonia amicalis]|uniref:hypothetical protein n=1 Tax=Gordonia amicalis TaxID=89053 RepID=UPI0024B98830|nr:hypothetical protein [Gordonia amicalis]MDJ0454388.1 hypothetical protein [Gordonia amicalis]MDV7077723.1 hypothetical protein [Gordonia amicalis]